MKRNMLILFVIFGLLVPHALIADKCMGGGL
jgi:hypothetical protein